MNWAEHVASTGETRSAYKILAGKDLGVDGKIIFTMHLREIGWGGVDWINLALDGEQCRTVVNALMNLRVP